MMNELSVLRHELPSTAEDVSRFVLVKTEQLAAVQAEIRAMEKVGVAKEVVDQKLKEGQLIGKLVLLAKAKLGELTLQMKAVRGGDRKSENFKRRGTPTIDPDAWYKDIDETGDIAEAELEKQERIAEREANKTRTKEQQLKDMGLPKWKASTYERIYEHPELIEEAVAEAEEKGEIATEHAVMKKIRAEKKKAEILEAEKAVHERASADFKPYLTVGNGIGFKPVQKYDLLLTDPPYSTDVEDIDKFVDNWLYNALDNVKPTGFAYIFIGAYPEEVRAYLNAKTPEHISLCQLLTWTYKNTLGNNPKDRYKQNYQVCLFYRGKEAPDLNCPLTSEQWAVQEINAPDGRQGDRYHAWQKPMEIAERFVRHSTEQGMTVFDPFACTGTFLLAATKLGRKAYGFEIDPANADIAFSRGCVKNE